MGFWQLFHKKESEAAAQLAFTDSQMIEILFAKLQLLMISFIATPSIEHPTFALFECKSSSTQNVLPYQHQKCATLLAPKMCYSYSTENVQVFQHPKCAPFQHPKCATSFSTQNVLPGQHRKCARLSTQNVLASSTENVLASSTENVQPLQHPKCASLSTENVQSRYTWSLSTSIVLEVPGTPQPCQRS